MTAKDIYEHPEYFNPEFAFPNEQWRPLHRARFTRYKQSNCFRVKNEDLNRIMKPTAYTSSKRFTMRLTDDNGNSCKTKPNG